MARKKKSLKRKKIETFLAQKMNNAKILHLILKQKELVRGVQAQRVEP
jgi:hypothetical protein